MSTTSRDRTSTAGLAALALAATMALTSCGSGDSKADASASATPSGSVSTSPSPSDSGSTGVAPATGKLIETSWFTVRAPEHSKVDVMGKDFHIDATGPAGHVTFGIIPLGAGHEYTVAQLARHMRGFLPGLEHADLGQTTTIDGEPAYLLTSKEQYHVSSDAGLTHGGQIIHMSVSTYGSRSQNLRMLKSVLATWQWK